MQYEAIYKVQGTLGPIPNVWESTGYVYDSVSCMGFYPHLLIYVRQNRVDQSDFSFVS